MTYIVTYKDGSSEPINAANVEALKQVVFSKGKALASYRQAGLMDLCQRTPEPPSRTEGNHGTTTGCSNPEEHRRLHAVRK